MAPKCFSFLSIFLVIGLVCSTCTATSALFPGQRLTLGQSLIQGRYVLFMHPNCDLQLLAPSVVWSSGTAGKGSDCYATLQTDGNFVVFSGSGRALWSSGGLGPGTYILELQVNRDIVIYGPAIWKSNTNISTAGLGKLALTATT